MNKDNTSKKHWKVLERREKFKGGWIDLNVDKILLPDGSTIDYEALDYHKGGVVLLLRMKKERLYLLRTTDT